MRRRRCAGLVGRDVVGLRPVLHRRHRSCSSLLRRRWLAAAIATVPTAAGLGVVVAGLGAGSRRTRCHRRRTRRCRVRRLAALDAMFQGMTGDRLRWSGISLLATLAVAAVAPRPAGCTTCCIALAITDRVDVRRHRHRTCRVRRRDRRISRYVYMGAMLLAPTFGVAVDQLRPCSPRRRCGPGAAAADRLGVAEHRRLRTNGDDGPTALGVRAQRARAGRRLTGDRHASIRRIAAAAVQPRRAHRRPAELVADGRASAAPAGDCRRGGARRRAP